MEGGEREREGGEAGSISERGELELKLSPAVDTVSGQILFFSERRQMFGYQVRNRSLLLLFFLTEDGKWSSNQSFLRRRNFLILLPCCFLRGQERGEIFRVHVVLATNEWRNGAGFCIFVEIISIFFLF